ncbi:MAG: RagB/SusD family nutrient uptake outer membrane protein [Bacteroidia bacterium]|nr:RagB/SusD family nutrient uptake outer membrane protein [Bacteroidia bacterium]
MKKYILTLCTVLTLGLTSCDDFLDRPQLDKVEDNKNFWRNGADFRMYSIDFYPWFFTGYNTGYGVNYTPLRGYTFNDDVVSGEGIQSNFITTVPNSLGVAVDPDKLADQAWYAEYNGEKWNFGWVRKANIMLQRTEDYKANLTEEEYKHWTAVARFFRAYAYYNLVISFGDVPYFDKPVSETEPDVFFKDRDKREVVMDHVYDDLKYAIDNAVALDNGSTQYVNKSVIAGLASRIMLFEGTWQKYHNLSAERAKKYLEFCQEASEVIMKTKKYACSKDFRSIFGSNDLKGHPEVIFYRHYAPAMATHAIASYSNGEEGQPGANLNLIKSFICTDGRVYKNSTVSNVTDFNLATLAKTRDPRFEATFFNFPNKKSQTMLYADKFISRLGASYWNNVANRPNEFGSSNNVNDAPIIRYAEVLLNWIEAKAELAESYSGTAITQEDLDLSINAIRNRPLDAEAIANGVQKTAPLMLNALPTDPDRDTDVSALIWEIRRERRMEFVYEHTRLLDIKRWKKLQYMDNTKNPDTMYGTWVNFSLDLPEYLAKSYEGKLTVRKADGTEVVYNGTNKAEMVGFYKVMNVQPRQEFTDKVYLSPVGKTEINDYKTYGYTLTQTEPWK